MEDLNLTELVSYYVKKIPVIVLATFLMVLVGYIYVSEIQVPLYHGTTTIILVQKMDDSKNANVTQSDISLNEKLVTTYSQIMKSRRVLEQVIHSLNLKMSYEELKRSIMVTSVNDTSIIKVSVSNEDNKIASVIANELAIVFKNEISKIYNLENISIIDEAIVESKPYNVHFLKQLVLFGVIGFVVACGIIFVVFYFDNTIKNKKVIESKLHLAVLGEIPIANKLAIMEKRRAKNKDLEDTLDFDSVDDIYEIGKVKKIQKGVSK